MNTYDSPLLYRRPTHPQRSSLLTGGLVAGCACWEAVGWIEQ